MKKKILIFFLGAICFMVSQPLLRIPILNYLQGSTKFIVFYTVNPLLVGILIAFSAGLFEESFRFLFRKVLIKTTKIEISMPIAFGLGHGLAEALIILLPFAFTVSLKILMLPIVERVLAIVLHIGLTVIVWNGFQLNKKLRYLILAILVHGLVNSLIPILSSTKNWIIIIESSLALIDVFVIIYIYKSRKYYFPKEEKL